MLSCPPVAVQSAHIERSTNAFFVIPPMCASQGDVVESASMPDKFGKSSMPAPVLSA